MAFAMASVSAFATQQTPDEQLTYLQKEMNQLETQVKALKKEVKVEKINNKTVAKPTTTSHNLFGNMVVTAPYTGRDNFSNGLYLLVNAPSVNEDVDLMKRRITEKIYLQSQGITQEVPQPRLVLSGKVEAKANETGSFTGGSSSDIDLSGAEIDFLAEMTPFLSGFMDINYDHDTGPVGNRTGSRLNNARMKLDRGFLTIGNLARSSFYASAGQLVVPFGRYSSSMIADPLTHFGKTKARALVIGYYPIFLTTVMPYASVFVFKGDSKYGNSNIIKQNGGDLGINFTKGKIRGNLGASYIRNIADSSDMQNNGNLTDNQFQGFSITSTTENLAHGVAAADIYGNIGYGPFNLLGEYISTLQSFNDNDLSFNSDGAKPKAYNVEGAYAFFIWQLPASVAIGYQHSYEALALSLPEQRYVAAFEVAPFKDTSATVELRHDIDYDSTDTANGASQSSAITGTGHSINAIVAQFDVYF